MTTIINILKLILIIIVIIFVVVFYRIFITIMNICIQYNYYSQFINRFLTIHLQFCVCNSKRSNRSWFLVLWKVDTDGVLYHHRRHHPLSTNIVAVRTLPMNV